LNDLQPQDDTPIDPQLLDEDVEIQLTRIEETINAMKDEDASNDEGEDIPSDDEESDTSVDSIARNADFISLSL
jgi:hypothetical protein